MNNRARIAAKQAALVECLINNTAVPDGFDESRVQVSSSTLRIKRLRTITRMHPWTREILKDRQVELFEEYCQTAPAIPAEGAVMDAAQFITFLQEKNLLPQETAGARLKNILATNRVMRFAANKLTFFQMLFDAQGFTRCAHYKQSL